MKNKILLAFISTCLIAVTAFANQVSVQDAKNVALNFYKLKTANASAHLQLAASLKYTRKASDSTVLFYVFNISPAKGFVIISATDNDIPVIGYSTESNFGNDFSKIGLNEWLGRWSEELHRVISKQFIATPRAATQWSAYRQGISPGSIRSFGVGPLCTTTWDQENEDGTTLTYNADCPYNSEDGQAITGCVATTMAQIMKYWNYPTTGYGTATYDDVTSVNEYSSNYGVLSFNYTATTFDWADMPDSITSNSSSTQISAVAQLMYAAGVSVYMDYGADASGAWVIQSESTYGVSAQTAYPTNFGYNPNTIQGLLETNYDNTDWISLIENELNAARPVEYQGFGNAGGHTWVCDGYDANDNLHMNWGWSGIYDGYFAITSLDPGNGDDFTYNLAALIGIEPGVYATAGANNICKGDSTQLAVSGNTNNGTYAWSPTTGLSCSTCATTEAAPQSTTTYTVTVTSTSSTVTSSVIINVIQPGVFTYSLSDSSICSGNSATLGLPGIIGASITPSASVTWIDSTDATLTPTGTTTYNVTSQSSICGAGDDGSFTLHVNSYSAVSVSLTDSVLCEDGEVGLSVTGLTDVVISPTNYYEETTNYYLLEPQETTTFTVTGTTSCGSAYTTNLTVYVVAYGNLPYTLSQNTICAGDTAILTLAGLSDISISPDYSAISIGNNQYLLIPDVSTTYYVDAYSTACDEYIDGDIEVIVVQPGLNYTISPTTPSCEYAYADLTISGVIQPVTISPYEYLNFTDPNDAYADFEVDTTTTFTISAQTVCGSIDTAYVTVVVEPSPAVSPLEGTVCSGDSAIINIVGLNYAEIYPSTGYAQINSTQYAFFPGTTTEYEIYGTACNGYDDDLELTVTVLQPGGLNYEWEDSLLCGGSESELYLYGITNAQFTPSTYIDWADSTDAYVYFYPTQTTTYALTATTVCGSTINKNFTVIVESEPSYNLQSSAICAGNSTTMTVKGLSSATIYPTTGVTWVNDTLVKFNPTATTDYYLEGYSCSGYYEEYELEITVQQNGSLSYEWEDSALCTGNESELYLSGVTSAQFTPAVYIDWLDSTDAYVYFYPTQTTTYALTATTVCGTTVTHDFTVLIEGEPSYKLKASTICAGNSTTMTVSGLNSVAIYPSTGVTWVNDTLVEFNPTESTDYELEGYTCSGYYEEYEVDISVLTTSGLQYEIEDSMLCPDEGGTYVYLSGASGITVSPYVYLDFEDSTDVYGYFEPTQTTTYVAKGTSVCTNSAVTASFTIYVSQGGTYVLTNPTVCNGDSTLLEPIGLEDVQVVPTTYMAYDGANYYLFPPTTTYYTLSGYSYCTDEDYSQYIEITATTHPVTITASPDSAICNGDTATICADAGFLSYIWSTTPAQTGQCVAAVTPGYYNVSATDANNCHAVSNQLYIQVYTQPNDISQHNDTLLADTASAYQWFINGLPVINATRQFIVATQGGAYTVELTSSKSCQSFSKPFYVTGIPNINGERGIQVYPNPSAGHWFIQADSKWIGSLCEIYDAEGKLVYSAEIGSAKSELVIDLAAGIYTLKITGTTDVYSTRLVKM